MQRTHQAKTKPMPLRKPPSKCLDYLWPSVHSSAMFTSFRKQIEDLFAIVGDHCDDLGIQKSTFTNQTLGSTYAESRMLATADRMDSQRERMLDSVSDRPLHAPATNPPPTGRSDRRSLYFDLPVPPSINAMYAEQKDKVTGKTRRIKSESYAAWKRVAGQEVLAIRGGLAWKSLPLDKIYVARIRISDNEKGDVDNRIKALLDLMVWMNITPDDKYLAYVSCGRSAAVPMGRAHVTLRSVPIPFAVIRP